MFNLGDISTVVKSGVSAGYQGVKDTVSKKSSQNLRNLPEAIEDRYRSNMRSSLGQGSRFAKAKALLPMGYGSGLTRLAVSLFKTERELTQQMALRGTARLASIGLAGVSAYDASQGNYGGAAITGALSAGAGYGAYSMRRPILKSQGVLALEGKDQGKVVVNNFIKDLGFGAVKVS